MMPIRRSAHPSALLARAVAAAALAAAAIAPILGAGCAATNMHGVPDGSGDGADDEGSETDGVVTCTSDTDCNDRIGCTVDHCDGGTCTHTPCTDCCDDGEECIPWYGCGVVPPPCTTDEECQDDIPCTIDRCTDGERCEHIAQDDLCEDGEICLAAVGCIPEPPGDCGTDEECREALPCVAEWYCDPEFGCQFLSIIDCGDDDPCTLDSCDEASGDCVHDPLDADSDGYATLECGADDCDDDDALVHPGALELCNGIDDDCDGDVDEGFECDPAGEAEDCATTCGTTGTHECGDACAWEECVPPDEACNGEDDDCDDDVDEDFFCARGSSIGCTTSCASEGTRECTGDCSAWDTCVPPDETCNGLDDNCNSARDDGFFCVQGEVRDCSLLGWWDGSAVCEDDCLSWDQDACTDCGNGLLDLGEDCDVGNLGGNDCTTLGLGFAAGALACSSLCTFDTTLCNHCGNSAVDAGEDCDGSNLGGDDCTTLGLGYVSGALACTSLCVFDTSACSRCGNAAIDPGEQCDGGDLGSQTCTSIPGGYSGGALGCSETCTFDASECFRCGDGTVDPGESCDGSNLGGNTCLTVPGGFTGGTLSCTGACGFDTSLCTTASFQADGTYDVAPDISYTCAFGMVSISLPTLTFIDNGTTLTVQPAMNGGCFMTGPSAETTRNINVTCLFSGTCNETYSLTGSFDTDDHWAGTWSATYTGSCFGCTAQSRSVSGTRL